MFCSEWRQRSNSIAPQDDQLPHAGHSLLTVTPLAHYTRSTDGFTQGKFPNFSKPLQIYNCFLSRTLKNKPVAVENRHAPADRDSKTQLARKLVDRRHSQQLPKSLTLPLATSGQALTILQSPQTITITVPRALTTTNKARRKIYRAQTVEPPRRRSGDATCAVKWCATLVDCTLNCTV